jgi:hypothetical protein
MAQWTWKPVSNSIKMKAVTFDSIGTKYAISLDGRLLSQSPRSTIWSSEFRDGRKVKYVTYHRATGDVLALDSSSPLIYVKKNGVWETFNGFGAQFEKSMNGTGFLRHDDGTVSSNDMGNLQGNYQHISPMTIGSGILLAGKDNVIYGYEPGSITKPLPLPGKAKGRMIVGSGTGLRASMFTLGPVNDNNVYYFEVSPTGNTWPALPGNIGFSFIAMMNSTLYGISLSGDLHILKIN